VIAVDTSALVAIVLHEEPGPDCSAAMKVEDSLLISAATAVEALIVAYWRDAGAEMQILLDGAELDVIPVTADQTRRIAAAHAKWGRGARTAGLNFGDCFAYDLAKANDCPLLYAGKDFAKTDVKSALKSKRR
jgi:ribonuclease VapC